MSVYPQDFLLDRLLYRDGLILVINKPAGLPVHAGPGGGETLEDYFDALRFGLPRPPALAHRLDRDTSGCLILGRHPKALRRLGKLFQANKIEKTYLALVKGAPSQSSGRIDLALTKQTTKNGWRMIVDETGQEALTTYRTLASSGDISLIEAKPKTGRTHQIRVHLNALGCPIIGDPAYGGLSAAERAEPMMLHARRLIIPLSAHKDPICVEAPIPDYIQNAMDARGLEEKRR